MKLLSIACVLTLGWTTGCKSDADDLTLDGVDDLKNCDIHAARDKFIEAHAADRDHPQAALGFALTSLALLPEDPLVTEILLRIGFTSAIDMQALVFGPDGVLARHARGDTCTSIDSFVDSTVPYPPLATPTIDAWTLVDPSLEAADFVSAADTLSPKLGDIAAALETAAAGMAEPVEIDGGCGVGTVTFQAPELYAAAAVIEGFRSIVALAQAYDWNVSIREVGQVWDTNAPAVVATLNAHIGRVILPSAGAAAHPILAHGLDLLVNAVDAANGATVEPAGLFDWTQVPVSLLDNIRTFAVAGKGVLDGSTPLPGITPAIALDLSTVFTAPIDFQTFGTPLFEAFDMFSVELNGATLEQALGPRFSPDPFAATAPPYTWTLDAQWSSFDATPVTMPFDRYDTIYQCMTSVPL